MLLSKLKTDIFFRLRSERHGFVLQLMDYFQDLGDVQEVDVEHEPEALFLLELGFFLPLWELVWSLTFLKSVTGEWPWSNRLDRDLDEAVEDKLGNGSIIVFLVTVLFPSFLRV